MIDPPDGGVLGYYPTFAVFRRAITFNGIIRSIIPLLESGLGGITYLSQQGSKLTIARWRGAGSNGPGQVDFVSRLPDGLAGTRNFSLAQTICGSNQALQLISR